MKPITGVTRPLKGRRLLVDVHYRLTQEELGHIFLRYTEHLDDPDYVKNVTPTVDTLVRVVTTMLWMHGDNAHRPLDGVAPTPEQLTFIERCTQRLWNSSRVVTRPTPE